VTVAGPGLQRHYDGKYAVEAAGATAETIPRVGIPTNRFEACRRFFPELFRGGDVLELAAGSGLVARSLMASGLAFESYTASDFSDARREAMARA
jgi:hypothetical protein